MREKQKAEAIWRLKKFGVMSNIINELRENDTVFYSERSPIGGILYWIKDQPEWVRLIKEWETETGCFVYHATHEHTSFGECLTLLYVSANEEEWEYDHEDMEYEDDKYGFQVIAHVINLTHPDFSETGSVYIEEHNGGLVRMA